MTERGIAIDRSTAHRCAMHFSHKLPERFHHSKRQVELKWNLNETYVEVKGPWMYLYRAIDSRQIDNMAVLRYRAESRLRLGEKPIANRSSK